MEVHDILVRKTWNTAPQCLREVTTRTIIHQPMSVIAQETHVTNGREVDSLAPEDIECRNSFQRLNIEKSRPLGKILQRIVLGESFPNPNNTRVLANKN